MDDYAAFARANRGDPSRGRSLFADPRGLGCNKCHRVDGAGGEGGPDLSRVATNYSRAELIESVLFPSKKVADGFRTTSLALADGQVLSGLVVADSGERLVLIDGKGEKHDVRKSDVEQKTQSDKSPMPDGLQAGLTLQEFADLIAYLETLSLSTPSATGFDVTGLSHPVCFIVDPGTGDYFIANVNGAPAARDNNGFITKLDPRGHVIALKFIGPSKASSLHAPKGLAIVGKTLYVLDLDHVRGYDTERGGLVLDIDMAPYKATFLNDLTRDAEGNLYLSDSQSNFVARIEPEHGHRVTILARGPQLSRRQRIEHPAEDGPAGRRHVGDGAGAGSDRAGHGQALARPAIREARRRRLRRRRQPLLLCLRGGQGLPDRRGRKGLCFPRRTRHARGYQHRSDETTITYPFLRRELSPRGPAGEMIFVLRNLFSGNPANGASRVESRSRRSSIGKAAATLPDHRPTATRPRFPSARRQDPQSGPLTKFRHSTPLLVRGRRAALDRGPAEDRGRDG